MSLVATAGKDLAAVEADAQTGIAAAATAQSTANAAGALAAAAIPETEKGAANGVATLGAGSKLPSAQIAGVLASSDLTNDAALEKTANKGAVSGYAALDASQLVVQDPANLAISRWQKFTIPLATLQALGAVGAGDVEVYSLPAGHVIEATKIKHSQAFASVVGPLTAAVASVGPAGNFTKYTNAGTFDVFQAVTATAFAVYGVVGGEDQGGAVSIRLRVTLTGDTFDNLTAGAVDVWLKVGAAT